MFDIVYHYLVVSKDIPKLSKEWKKKILSAIERRLATHPDLYSKPLRQSLKNYRKLRIADYRVVFKVERTLIKILIIEHRSVAYLKINKRI